MSALSYTTVGFAALFGLALWQQHPDLLGWLGLGVLVVAGLLAASVQAEQKANLEPPARP